MNNQGWERVMALNALRDHLSSWVKSLGAEMGKGQQWELPPPLSIGNCPVPLGEQMAGTIVASTPSVSLLKQRSVC